VRQDDHPVAAPDAATYGTWIRTGRLYLFAVLSLVALAGASLTLVSPWFALLLLPAALFGYIAVVLGLTVWRLGGASWEYSKDQCDRNARVEGVDGRTTFVRQSAASLRFDDATFDVVVSCLTFHEVRDVTDKSLLLAEALRVLRPGGRYVFLDLFADPRVFGPVERVRRCRSRWAAGRSWATPWSSPA